ncbi:MAG: glyoxalase [SAR86 cluster bacterium]|uniref:Glyoxalase n=1 Tax=SAR86 cluster bacterium TaxID=2030880 RepID=A0A2A4MDT7_9GAMM|nr:MAG: glyoxalase [SAR86 cluster bacterium]
MNKNGKINYVEFPTKDLAASKVFFEQVFDWRFEDYGPEYTAFFDTQTGLDGGFFKSELASTTANGAALIVFYSDAIKATQAKIEAAGGSISKALFSFPGGQRFHFIEPSGNELAVWTDVVDA